MNKKGFTLVELLAILVILSVIVLVSVTSIVSIAKNEENNDDLYDTIYMAAETYIYNNYNNFKELDTKGFTSLVSVIDLINNDYLKSNIINPLDGETFTSNDYIEVTRNDDMTLSFKIVDSFSAMLKLNQKDSYTNGTDEFVTAIFDKEGGTVECYNQLGKLDNLTFNALALGKNEISCTAVGNNGSTAALVESIVVNGYFDYSKLIVDNGGYKLNNNIVLPQNAYQYGPYYKMLQGCYKVEISGTNLSLSDGLSSYEHINGVNNYNTLLSKSLISDKLTYYINVGTDLVTTGIEFYYKNLRSGEVTINNIKVTLIDSCPAS